MGRTFSFVAVLMCGEKTEPCIDKIHLLHQPTVSIDLFMSATNSHRVTVCSRTIVYH